MEFVELMDEDEAYAYSDAMIQEAFRKIADDRIPAFDVLRFPPPVLPHL